MSFLREVFSESKEGSASRVMMLIHGLAGIVWVTHVVIHEHKIPDAATLSGVTAFAAAPYAINKFQAGVAAIARGNGTPPA